MVIQRSARLGPVTILYQPLTTIGNFIYQNGNNNNQHFNSPLECLSGGESFMRALAATPLFTILLYNLFDSIQHPIKGGVKGITYLTILPEAILCCITHH